MNKVKNKIYLANDLFSEATLAYNEMLYEELISMGFEVYAPQKNTSINDKSKAADSVAIYHGDTEMLKWCDYLLAVIDGPVVDPGVAAEIGWVAGYNDNQSLADSLAIMYGDDVGPDKKVILGLYTDTRDGSKTAIPAKNEMLANGVAESQYPYVNLYVVGAIKKNGVIFSSSDELFKFLGSMPTLTR